MTGSVMRRRASLVGLLVLLCLLPVFVPAHAASGGLDPAFGTSGEVTTPFGGAGAAATVVQQADGKLVAVGAAAVASAGQVGFGVARYNSDGSLDPTFGPGGTVTTGFGDDVAVASAVTVLADGRILVAGFGLRSDGTDIVLARYTPLGVLDPSFGAGTGTVTTPKGADELTTSLVLRPDGTFVVAGGDSADFVLAGYTADGTLDSTFGTAGFAVTPLAEPAGASAVALQPDGKLVAAGTAGGDVGVVRYNPNGSLDTAFGAGTGQATTDFGASDDAGGVVVQPDGKLVIAGTSQSRSTANAVFARYQPDGTLDPTFGTAGRTVTGFDNADLAAGLGVAADGSLIAVGAAVCGSTVDFAAYRLTPTGDLDPSFGDHGRSVANFGGPSLARGLVIQPDGKAVEAGAVLGDNSVSFGLARYLTAGEQTIPACPAPTEPTSSDGSNPSPARDLQPAQPAPSSPGYWFTAGDGGVFSFGNTGFFGSTGATPLNKPIVAMAATPTGNGYWFAAADGGIFAFGDAAYAGSMGGHPLNKPVVSMAAAPTGRGYWLTASDGGVFSFGDVGFFGSMGGHPLNKPIVAMAATPTGKGYWFAAADGGIFAFGDAGYYGSTGAQTLNSPIVAMAATPTGHGYWLAAADGGIFAFGDAAFLGSMGATRLAAPIVSMAATASGQGYWLVAADGGIFAFGDAGFFGSMGGQHLNRPIVAMAAPTSTPGAAARGSSDTSASARTQRSLVTQCGTVQALTSFNPHTCR